MKVKGLVALSERTNSALSEWLVGGRRGTSIEGGREGGGRRAGQRSAAAARDSDSSGQLELAFQIFPSLRRPTLRIDGNVRGMAFGKGEGPDSVRLHLGWREGGREGGNLAREMH